MILLNRGCKGRKQLSEAAGPPAIARNARYYFRVLTRTREFRDRLFPWSVLSQERIMDANADASKSADKVREREREGAKQSKNVGNRIKK